MIIQPIKRRQTSKSSCRGKNLENLFRKCNELEHKVLKQGGGEMEADWDLGFIPLHTSNRSNVQGQGGMHPIPGILYLKKKKI